jgi:hypothetical protein
MKQKIALSGISVIGCLLCGILLCAAQTSLLPMFLNDSFFVLDLLLCLTIALGTCGGPAFGALFGIYAGILADCTGGFGICILPLFYMLCGYFAFVAADMIPYKKFVVYLATGAICVLLRALVAMIYVMLSSGSVPLLDVLRYVCIPIILGTVLVLPAAYPLGLLLTLPVRKIKHNSIDKIM